MTKNPGGKVRRAGQCLVVALSTLGFLLLPTNADGTTWNTACETYMVNHIQAARKSHHLRPYAVNSSLRYYSRKWSYWMAQHNTLKHDPNLTRHWSQWRALGQNVGEGPTCSSIWSAFMNSREHRSNILDRNFTQVGVGVYRRNGLDWVTQDFREP